MSKSLDNDLQGDYNVIFVGNTIIPIMSKSLDNEAIEVNFVDDAEVINLSIGDGSVAQPSLKFTTDTDTGIYKAGTDTLGFAAGGSTAMTLDANTATVNNVSIGNGTAAQPSLTFTNDNNTGIYSVGNNILGISTAGSDAMTFDTNSVDTTRFDINQTQSAITRFTQTSTAGASGAGNHTLHKLNSFNTRGSLIQFSNNDATVTDPDRNFVFGKGYVGGGNISYLTLAHANDGTNLAGGANLNPYALQQWAEDRVSVLVPLELSQPRMEAARTVNQTIPHDTETVVDFTTVANVDITNSSGLFTVNRAGQYMVAYQIYWSASQTDGQKCSWIELNSNTNQRYGFACVEQGAVNVSQTGSAVITCAANDTLRIVVNHNNAALATVDIGGPNAAQSRVQIYYLG